MPTVTWSKGGVNIEDSDEMESYYDEAVDAHFLEIFECKSKDTGNYKVTATNIFSSESAPVSLVMTQNPDEVVDYNMKLKNRSPRKLNAEEGGPDWGKLKKAGSRAKKPDDGPEGFKLKHWEKEKTGTESTGKTDTDKVYFLK